MKYASTFERYVFRNSRHLRDLPVGQRQVVPMSAEEENRRIDWLEGNPQPVLTYKATWRRCIVSISTSLKQCEDKILNLPITAHEMMGANAHLLLRRFCEQHYGKQAIVHVLPDVLLYCTPSNLRLFPSQNVRRITGRDVNLVIDSLSPEMRTFCDDAASYILDNGPAFAWYEADKPVGYACVHPSFMSDKVGNVGNVNVAEKFRRKGIAKAIVAAIAKELFADGRMPVYGCYIDNVASVNTALSVGFKLAECNYRVYVARNI